MSKIILAAISYLCVQYKSKSALWYRNFLIKKYNPNVTYKLTQKLQRNKQKEIDERFYWTYLSEIVCDKKIKIEDFLSEKNKKQKYYNSYEKFDFEYGTKTRLYGLTTKDYHEIKKKKVEKVKKRNPLLFNW